MDFGGSIGICSFLNSSSLHWLVLVLFYSLFVQWSIFPLANIFKRLKGNIPWKLKNLLFSIFEVTDPVGGSTQNVSLRKESE